jgi:hypothetical protein
MKLRNKWEGITMELLKKSDAPLAFKQRFEGATEADKVLVHNEQVNIDGVVIKIGGFEYEVEMSVEESIQQIKNVSALCQVIRDEINNFADFVPAIVGKVEGIVSEMDKSRKPDPTVEPAPVEETPAPVTEVDLATKIKEGIAAALASMGVNK